MSGVSSTFAPAPAACLAPFFARAIVKARRRRTTIVRCRDGARRPDDERSVQAKVCNRISQREFPVEEMRLNDFKAMRDPIDRRQQFDLVGRGARRLRKVQDDLGLDPGLGQVTDGQPRGRLIQPCHGAVVHVSPHRARHTVLVPDQPVREADLPADRRVASRAPAP